MHVEQLTYASGRWWGALDAPQQATGAQLVLVFGERRVLLDGAWLESLRARYPAADIVSCSGGGHILGTHVSDAGLVATAILLESGHVEAVDAALPSAGVSETVGATLAGRLPAEGLRHVLVFAEGLHVNGSGLARGLTTSLPPGVAVSGGLAADDDRFEQTAVGLNAVPASGRVVAVGLYGEALDVGVGSVGGWDAFGDEHRITRSSGNVLFELDGRKALELYKELLGPLGYALPASGLMFPLKVRENRDDAGVVRTILGVDEDAGSLTFAGDVPQGWSATLVRTNLDQLIRAAGAAARRTGPARALGASSFALAVSCIGRKLLLQQRVGEELTSARRALGETTLAGFYSYGELAPSTREAPCELHNQTMTITRFSER